MNICYANTTVIKEHYSALSLSYRKGTLKCYLWCVMCDVWCVMCDVWCVMCDVWWLFRINTSFVHCIFQFASNRIDLQRSFNFIVQFQLIHLMSVWIQKSDFTFYVIFVVNTVHHKKFKNFPQAQRCLFSDIKFWIVVLPTAALSSCGQQNHTANEKPSSYYR